MSRRYIYFGSFASVSWFSDLFGMPDAAYSLRKLTPNATNCIRVRRSSDNTEQDIGFVANAPDSPIDTSTLLSFVGSGNGFVTTAYNQNTSGTNFTQESASNQPRIVNGGVLDTNGGLASLFFLTSGFSELINASLIGYSNFTTFRVHDTNDVEYLTYSGNLGSGGSLYNYVAASGDTSTNIFSGYGTPSLFVNGSTPSPLTNRNHVYNAQNGRKILSEKGSTSTWNNFTIGGYASGFNFSGYMPEFIAYFSDQLSQRTAIETNINDYYNVF
jgi:hypothetical protein